MKNKQIIRIITQSILVMITTFTILEFYLYDIPYIIKWVTTIALIALNAIYSHWCGVKNGVDICKETENRMREFEEERFNKLLDMVVKEKKADR